MRKIFKLFTASLLTVSLSVATVICCCSASAVMAHFHKVAMCGHCSEKSSHDNSSNPDATCKYQLTSAEFSHSKTLSFSIPTVSIPFVFDRHLSTPFLPSVISSYPRGSPPLTASFIPLYLRTFTLRI